MSRSLSDWLTYQETLHPRTIDLGLDRLARVLERLKWRQPRCPVITVGGTNGKGSCVALLEAILSAQDYRVGTFTSPHLIRYNERVRIAGREISDAELVAAFERIEAARGEVSLTFFEFNTLAVLLAFDTPDLDVWVLEVGMGGRLDSVNIVDADVAIVSSVALDHCEWLGNDVDTIGREKAGIFRAGRPAIFGSRSMPATIASEAVRIGARLLALGAEFDHRSYHGVWEWRSGAERMDDLPLPALPGKAQLDNAAAVLTALQNLRDRLPLKRAAIETGLRTVALPGRFQSIRTTRNGKSIEWRLDVAHNPAAASTLADNLASQPSSGRTFALCGMFGDKDVRGVIGAVLPYIDAWIVTAVNGARAMPPEKLAQQIRESGGTVEYVAESVAAACEHAMTLAQEGDRIVAFGSFYTVGPVLEWLQDEGDS